MTTTITARWRDLTATMRRLRDRTRALVHRPVDRIYAMWRSWLGAHRVRVAKRILRRDAWVLGIPQLLRSVADDDSDCPAPRKRCPECRKRVPLNADGRLRRHGDCAGGGELPAREGVSHS